MICPACDHTLTEVSFGKLTLDVCHDGCGGIWFDNFELPKVDDEVLGEAFLRIPYDEHRLVDYERRRSCPRCAGIVMMRHFFSERREVEVDTCPHCGGVWLDPGELAMIRRESQEKEKQDAAAKRYFQRLFEQDYLKVRLRGRSRQDPGPDISHR